MLAHRGREVRPRVLVAQGLGLDTDGMRRIRDETIHVLGLPRDAGGSGRGGSDRGFLSLIQMLGRSTGRNNRVVLVDSSGGELERPSQRDPLLRGLTDPEDPLHLDVLVPGGPPDYCSWFEHLAQARSR